MLSIEPEAKRKANKSLHWDFVFSNDSGRQLLSADDYEGGIDEDDYNDTEEDFFVAPKTTDQRFTPGFKSVRQRGKTSKNGKIRIGNYKGDDLFDERTRHLVHELIAVHNLRAVESLVHYGQASNLYFGFGHMYDDSTRERGVALKIFKASNPTGSDPTASKSDVRASRNSIQRQLNSAAEREFHNLTKARRAGVAVPFAYMSYDCILLMRFIGSDDGVPAPTVKSETLKNGELREVYRNVLLSMRRLYKEARLVHGNLGEDTILLTCKCWPHPAKVYFVNFSHAVDRSQAAHTAALECDIKNVQALFRSCGLSPSRQKSALNDLWDDEIVLKYVTTESTKELRKLLQGCYSNIRFVKMIY